MKSQKIFNLKEGRKRGTKNRASKKQIATY